jgi:hypothetical protein
VISKIEVLTAQEPVGDFKDILGDFLELVVILKSFLVIARSFWRTLLSRNSG